MVKVTSAIITDKETNNFGDKIIKVVCFGLDTNGNKTTPVFRDLQFSEGEWISEKTIIETILKYDIYAY